MLMKLTNATLLRVIRTEFQCPLFFWCMTDAKFWMRSPTSWESSGWKNYNNTEVERGHPSKSKWLQANDLKFWSDRTRKRKHDLSALLSPSYQYPSLHCTNLLVPSSCRHDCTVCDYHQPLQSVPSVKKARFAHHLCLLSMEAKTHKFL